MQYAVIIHPAEEGGYWAEVPTLPGCATQGETLDETLANTRTSIQVWLASLKDKGEPVPSSSDIVIAIDVAA